MLFDDIKAIIKEEKDRLKGLPTMELDLLWSFNSRQENAHSAIISYLLTNKEYLSFFLKHLQLTDINLEGKTPEVYTEYFTDQSRRIDIFIKIDENTCIIIENKIDAGDQDAQLYDYYQFISKTYKNIHMFYLTKEGDDPSEVSLCSLDRAKVLNISYENHIIPWLEDIYQTLQYNQEGHTGVNIFKSAIEQYIVSIHNILNIPINGDQTRIKILSLLAEVKNCEDLHYLLDQYDKGDIPEIAPLITYIKCLDVQCRFGGEIIYDNNSILPQNKKAFSIKYLAHDTPYYMGVKLNDNKRVIMFLNDRHNQFQILVPQNGLPNIQKQGYDLSYNKELGEINYNTNSTGL